MSTFVLVAGTFALLCLGAAGIAGVALVRAAKGLVAARSTAMERLGPLTAELAAEQAVAALEIDALRRTAAQSRGPRGRHADVHWRSRATVSGGGVAPASPSPRKPSTP